MGLFSTKKTVTVSSVPYNLAGDIDNRPNYLKTTLVGAVLGGDADTQLGETIVNAHLSGPGIKQRRYFNWAKANFPLGMPTADITSSSPVDPQLIINEFPPPEGLETIVQKAFIESANFFYIAEQHIYTNHPTLIDTGWTCDYSNGEIVIQYADTTTEIIPATNYNVAKDYVIAYYYYSKPEAYSALVEGVKSDFIYDSALLPATTGYTIVDTTVLTDVLQNLDETTVEDVTYSDGRPAESTTTVTSTSENLYEEKVEYRMDTYEGTTNSARARTRVDYITQWNHGYVNSSDQVTVVEEDIGGGVTKTTTTTVTTEFLAPRWKSKVDHQYLYANERQGNYQMLVYRIGGNRPALNTLQAQANEPLQEFFPFIPLRMDNIPIDHPNFADYWDGATGSPVYGPDFYDDCADAYKKATGESISGILEGIADNESIDDIDYAYLVYGVSLNTKEEVGKRYLYEFFRNLIPFQGTSTIDYETFLVNKDAHQAKISDYEDWYIQQQDPNSARYGTTAPAKTALDSPQYSTIQIKSNDPRVTSYDNRLHWVTIEEEILTGLGQAGAKKNDMWMVQGVADTWDEELGTQTEEGDNRQYTNNKIEKLFIYWQDTWNTYRRLKIRGLIHQNFVYDGRPVTITTKEALDDLEESGMIIPFHYPTLREMNLVDSTQLVTSNSYIVFNCYQVVKQRWYQRGWFKVLLVIAIAVATVYFAPAGAVTGGILGTNAAVGGFLGLSGTSALLVGAAVNAVAAMVLMNIVTEVSVKLFGEKWGAVVGVIAGFITMQGLTSLSTQGQLGMNWGSMMRMENIMQLTNVGANAYAAWARGDIAETYEQMQEAQKEYEAEASRLDELMQDLGSSGGVINPMMFTDAFSDGSNNENPTDFINRTTMVGSDMIGLSYSMIYDYADINLQLPKGD